MSAPEKRPGEVQIHLSGSPTVESVGAAADAVVRLINASTGRDLSWTVTGNVVCDTCGTRSEPVDLAHPDAAELALRAAGWVRDLTAPKDTCPACAATGVAS